MDLQKRYSGRGQPVNHWHIDTVKKGKHKNLDVLLFESGEYAVWNPDLNEGECISFHRSKTEAEMEAKRILGIKG
jgi:hypothetical protein